MGVVCAGNETPRLTPKGGVVLGYCFIISEILKA